MRANIIFYLLLISVLLFSCSTIKKITNKNYPKKVPFVFKNKIELTNNVDAGFNKLVLSNYWDDSIKVTFDNLLWFRSIKDPKLFNPKKLQNSKKNMKDFLQAEGYYYPILKDSFKIDTIKNQYRVVTFMNINIGRSVLIDSISYSFNNDINQLIQKNNQDRIIQNGDRLTNNQITNEIERLYNLLKSNGYYKIVRENILVEVDTLNLKKDINQNILAKIQFQLTENIDSNNLKKYKFGRLIFYPDLKLNKFDSAVFKNDSLIERKYKSITLRSYSPTFTFTPFINNCFIKEGNFYNENDYINSYNVLNRLGPWQQIENKIIPRNDSLDFIFYMYPSKKYSALFNFEGSLDDDFTGQNLLGLSASVTFLNRNVWKHGILSSTNIRYGRSLDLSSTNNNINIWQISQTYTIPKLIVPFKSNWFNQTLLNKKTQIYFNANYTDRQEFYKVQSITGSFGYEWKTEQKNSSTFYLYKPINIEIYDINELDSSNFNYLLLQNPFLKSSFNQGNVIGQQFTIIKKFKHNINSRLSNSLSFNIENSWGGLINLFYKTNDIYKYIKLEIEYKQTIKFAKTEFAFRLFGGVGFSSPSSTSLPFFKQFFVGGPNSMRAWSVRQLGLGSSITYDTIDYNQYRERYGDMKLELNSEYRFNLFKIGSCLVKSAFFCDIGNIWNINSHSNQQDKNSIFELGRLYKDIAMDIGTGIRLDFTYIMIRLDFAIKLKDPARNYNDGWLDFNRFGFTEPRINGVKIDNYAVQFNIGLPF